MLPAIIALSPAQWGIVGYLMGRHADTLQYRPDAPTGLNLYAYETVPRLYGQFLAYMLYRWEIIVREIRDFRHSRRRDARLLRRCARFPSCVSMWPSC